MKTTDMFVQNKIGKGEYIHKTMKKFHKNGSVIIEDLKKSLLDCTGSYSCGLGIFHLCRFSRNLF